MIRAAEALRGLDHDVAATTTLLKVFSQFAEDPLIEILRHLASAGDPAASAIALGLFRLAAQLRRHLAGQ
ncbi:MAG TPA: hypothetical protein DEG88_06315 [Propionibacteriaceae bacterium]|jgi:hypothetical protein|nr:hypothetical protein [Propionibacteriaceae bacterium]